MKRRLRNVALLGQFNEIDHNTVVDDVIFWTQKHKEFFDTVVPAGGSFTDGQVNALKEHSISDYRIPILMAAKWVFRPSREYERNDAEIQGF